MKENESMTFLRVIVRDMKLRRFRVDFGAVATC